MTVSDRLLQQVAFPCAVNLPEFHRAYHLLLAHEESGHRSKRPNYLCACYITTAPPWLLSQIDHLGSSKSYHGIDSNTPRPNSICLDGVESGELPDDIAHAAFFCNACLVSAEVINAWTMSRNSYFSNF